MQQLLTCSEKYLWGEVGLLQGVEGHIQAALVICKFSCTKYRYRLRSVNRFFLSDTCKNDKIQLGHSWGSLLPVLGYLHDTLYMLEQYSTVLLLCFAPRSVSDPDSKSVDLDLEWESGSGSTRAKKDEEILCLKSSVGLEPSPGAWMYSIGVGEGVGKTLFSFHKKNLRLDPDPIGSGFSNSLRYWAVN
jgi:hypothetical protein